MTQYFYFEQFINDLQACKTSQIKTLSLAHASRNLPNAEAGIQAEVEHFSVRYFCLTVQVLRLFRIILFTLS